MKQRIITAVVAAAIFIPIVILGGIPFLLLVYLLASIGLYELMKMKNMRVVSFEAILSHILLWVLLLPNENTAFLANINYDKVQIFLMGVLLLLLYTVVSKNRFTFDDAGFLVITILYLGMGFYYLFETRDSLGLGLIYILLALFTIWATDSGAYFIGKSLGKRKLWPEISPNKTVEGFFGGIFSALIVGVLFYVFSSLDYTLLQLLLISLIIAIFGQLGDLVQSAYKRHYGVKDSGKLLPGHGGILDRLDSLIFILPILHLLHVL
ncbi:MULTISPECIES: phosphatidate cytidylyltransferase [Peribacillus]|uniref:phosphatidate cytidylyltransferase n=1 Tax=Peribacillus TaxID=2675229 RepID=UPI0006F4007B|nr:MULTISPECIES: phosphatidate cytidylyltransferase [unclassified Peribacillus]KQU18714.1 phosphatidate cytidylyltransferase [Bacillus sp. Leaf13]KRF68291.1 phosphatidate cytidylyltransferase [Bacillus sp. Soil768D1]MBK5445940.1 phosphatidate cytidylyltransferase [Peribacillus sp. TH24]MBK5459347.1 phosphatidate cytidylyltransferase [Peribacillus sp. TH27]MBK5481151.1 phosphatidate cytidylyltransferase [Peribacillus sp. TH16]